MPECGDGDGTGKQYVACGRDINDRAGDGYRIESRTVMEMGTMDDGKVTAMVIWIVMVMVMG